ncbi:MAG: hypothetical protein IPK34_17140 [Ramlibacter sp.]|jgi:hypothetical protein|nr:hypothetical protein [Ramlibacter sp.]
MKTFFLLVSLGLLFVAVAFPLVVVVGGGDHRTYLQDRQADLAASNPVRRTLNRTFYWLAENRPFLGVVGALGLLTSIFLL